MKTIKYIKNKGYIHTKKKRYTKKKNKGNKIKGGSSFGLPSSGGISFGAPSSGFSFGRSANEGNHPSSLKKIATGQFKHIYRFDDDSYVYIIPISDLYDDAIDHERKIGRAFDGVMIDGCKIVLDSFDISLEESKDSKAYRFFSSLKTSSGTKRRKPDFDVRVIIKNEFIPIIGCEDLSLVVDLAFNLSKRGILYLDYKNDNVAYSDDPKPHAKIIDIGEVGTLLYAPCATNSSIDKDPLNTFDSILTQRMKDAKGQSSSASSDSGASTDVPISVLNSHQNIIFKGSVSQILLRGHDLTPNEKEKIALLGITKESMLEFGEDWFSGKYEGLFHEIIVEGQQWLQEKFGFEIPLEDMFEPWGGIKSIGITEFNERINLCWV